MNISLNDLIIFALKRAVIVGVKNSTVRKSVRESCYHLPVLDVVIFYMTSQ